MNKAPLFIIGSLSLVVIATAGWFVMNNAQEKTLVTAELVANTNYFDTVEGDFKNASVTYTNLAPSFDEKTIPLKSSSIETDIQSKLIGYEIELANNKFISITLDKDKNLISFKGLNPQDKISVTKNSKQILSPTPSDWSGKLTLLDNDIQINNDLCFKLIKQKIIVCHAKPSAIGGVS